MVTPVSIMKCLTRGTFRVSYMQQFVIGCGISQAQYRTPLWQSHENQLHLKAPILTGPREPRLQCTGSSKLTQRRESFGRNVHSSGIVSSVKEHASKNDLLFESSDLGKLTLEGAKFTTLAHEMWRRVVRPGDLVVDATCGNGNDTLALARLAISWESESDMMIGTVIALDKQAEAVATTKAILERSLFPAEVERIQLECVCHSQLRSFATPSSARLVVFNLGYLPGGNKEIITQPSSTVEALEASAELVAPGGLISVLAYVGHPEAWEEFEAVKQFAAGLSSQQWDCTLQERLNRPLCPRLLLLHKKAISH